ncbi:methyltransferase domain-containing protein [bacterium]|nr:methyltransferase domain-containing protein [bacterium]
MIAINLGCGQRKIPNYINVDLNPASEPEVLADITQKLPFDDNYADEICSFHVIEHLDRNSVDDIIDDWFRILKPGGKLVIECPDLMKIAKTLLQPFSHNHAEWARMTVMGIYGNPADPIPFMMHKWGYTPESLTRILKLHGFTNIVELPVQTHIPKRDMRIEAVKL